MEKDAAACLYIYNSLEFTDVYEKVNESAEKNTCTLTHS
jgi:hypothetical protein